MEYLDLVLIVKDYINKIRIFDTTTEKVTYEYLSDQRDGIYDVEKIISEKYGPVVEIRPLMTLHSQSEFLVIVRKPILSVIK